MVCRGNTTDIRSRKELKIKLFSVQNSKFTIISTSSIVNACHTFRLNPIAAVDHTNITSIQSTVHRNSTDLELLGPSGTLLWRRPFRRRSPTRCRRSRCSGRASYEWATLQQKNISFKNNDQSPVSFSFILPGPFKATNPTFAIN